MRLANMYEAVLREAGTDDQLKTWLDSPTLLRLWPDLVLPPQVRQLWERRFPQLAAGQSPPGRISADRPR